MLAACIVVHALENLVTSRQGCSLCLYISPTLSPLVLWFQCPCLGKNLWVVFHIVPLLWKYFHSFSGLLFVVAATLKLKALLPAWSRCGI